MKTPSDAAKDETSLREKLLDAGLESIRKSYYPQLQAQFKQLQESEERFRRLFLQNTLILNSASEGILGLDKNGNHTFVNPAAARMLGYEPQELIGMHSHSSWHHTKPDGSPYPKEECPIYAAFRDGAVHQVDTEVFWRKDGTCFPVDYASTPIWEGGQLTGAVVTFRDITVRKRAEEVLARSREELERLVRERTAKLQESVDELEHFSYSITHDMRAPLRAMRGFAELLLQEEGGTPASPTAKEFLERIVSAAARLDALILDALDYSKIARADMKLEPVDVGYLLCEIVNTYPNLHAHRAEIHLEGKFPMVLGNQAGLTQCFSNLLSNAVKFSAPGIRLQVRVRAERINGRIRLWFEDNGIGVPKGWEKKIFDLFQQAGKGYEGTGVGLAIVRKAIQRIGGEVGVESEPGKGSRFWVEVAEAVTAKEEQAH